ncbi:MAG: hypothetical protein HOW73_37040 [Polyangiaceae bacterium]|nr:hypothetical protein [Polyangiaceae bacterium]
MTKMNAKGAKGREREKSESLSLRSNTNLFSLLCPWRPSLRLCVFAVLSLLGCGPAGEPVAPGNIGVAGATSRAPIPASQRPDVDRSFPLDYDALPHLVTTSITPADMSAGIAMIRAQNGVDQARVGGNLLVEIELGNSRTFTAEPLEPSSDATQKPNGCVPRPGTSPVAWEGFSLASWTDLFIDYVRFEGTYDFDTCTAKPTRFARVRAPAVVPGVAYAFRTCVPVCTSVPAPGSREELLVIVGPPAKWVGATVPWPSMQTNPHVGLFSRIIVPLKRGGSASTFFHVAEPDLQAFLARRRTKTGRSLDVPSAPLIQLSFDFSWPEGDPSPVGIGFAGVVPGAPGSSGATSVYDFSDDVVEAALATP